MKILLDHLGIVELVEPAIDDYFFGSASFEIPMYLQIEELSNSFEV